nr:membrane protein b147 [Mastomys natalensis cytomegalovirus 3]WEG69963.1 membrane protein b147 [Mastomys natalensis cytomegalovirus 3]WEG70103.1 membrane protein b147 [Mastomys natalensis cytomegalovirus 3]WEG70243.1 membrane protein b147 [Mastomys natalensis cytomegalovirus 3]WEG70383.1 membrane protein b147 [Mastomys natalensis cytomegalovirus 3]
MSFSVYSVTFLLAVFADGRKWWNDDRITNQSFTLIFQSVSYDDTTFESDISFNYSFPILHVEDGELWQMYNVCSTNCTELNIFMTNKKYLESIRKCFDERSVTYTIRYECVFQKLRVLCTVTHMKDTNAILITLHHDKSMKILYTTDDGNDVLSILTSDRDNSLSNYDVKQLYNVWYDIHINMINTSNPFDVHVTADVHILNTGIIITCKAKSYGLTRFVISIIYSDMTETSDYATIDDEFQYETNGSIVVSGHVAIMTTKMEPSVFCKVKSESGWEAVYIGNLSVYENVTENIPMELIDSLPERNAVRNGIFDKCTSRRRIVTLMNIVTVSTLLLISVILTHHKFTIDSHHVATTLNCRIAVS